MLDQGLRSRHCCMTNMRIQRKRPIPGWGLLLTVLAWFTVTCLPAADVEIPLLKSGTDVFTNVTVYQRSETDIFIRHSRGFGNIKINKLDDETLILLGYKTAAAAEQVTSGNVGINSAAVQKVRDSLAAVNVKLPSESAMLDLMSRYRPTPDQLMIAAAVAAIAYLLCCFCLKQICLKAGSKPGLLIWLPILQIIPLLRAAQMPVWWFVVFLIPGLNVLAQILWCFRIVKACGKGNLVAVFLILPVTNVLAFLYLAFSKGNEVSEENGVKFDGRTAGLAEA
jgi:Family of unknown function (DUF5684)